MAGLSVVELLVAVAIGLFILTGLITVFVNSSAARNELERTSHQIENGRYAVEILSDDLRLAGFYGGLSPAGAAPGIAVPAAVPDPCSTAVADWGPALYLHVQGYNASNGGLTCLQPSHNYKTGTDVLVIRRVRTCIAGSTGCGVVAGGPYLQVSRCATESPATSHKLGLDGTETFDLKLKDCADTAPRRQYYVNIYFVSTDNGAGLNIPTLKKLEFTGTGAPTLISLVEGIEHMQVEYGLDCDGNGNPDTYQSNPNTYVGGGDCTSAVNNWMNVMTARFFLLARTSDTSPGYTDVKTYQLGATAVGPFSDSYRRHVFSSVVRTINPAGRRDAP